MIGHEMHIVHLGNEYRPSFGVYCICGDGDHPMIFEHCLQWYKDHMRAEVNKVMDAAKAELDSRRRVESAMSRGA